MNIFYYQSKEWTDMLDKLKNMEPLSPQEENRIMRKLRAVVLVMAGLVLAFAIWSIVKKRDFTAVYYVIVSVFLFCNWFLIDVAPAFLCRALAGRSDKKVSAFLKMAGLGLLGNIGLGWFLMSMQNQTMYGALVYLVSVIMARKQREIYYGPDDEDEAQEQAPAKEEEARKTPEHLPTAADRLRRLNEISAGLDADESGVNEEDAEITEAAAVTEPVEVTEPAEAAEENDGSV